MVEVDLLIMLTNLTLSHNMVVTNLTKSPHGGNKPYTESANCAIKVPYTESCVMVITNLTQSLLILVTNRTWSLLMVVTNFTQSLLLVEAEFEQSSHNANKPYMSHFRRVTNLNTEASFGGNKPYKEYAHGGNKPYKEYAHGGNKPYIVCSWW